MAGLEGLARLIRDLEALAALEHAASKHGVPQKVAEAIRDDAKARLGHYQEGWAPLAESTIAERERAGYPGDAPLLRTGQMRDDITILPDTGAGAGTDSVVVGIPADAPSAAYAMAQEMGTVDAGGGIPPRPFLGPAVAAHAEEFKRSVVAELGGAIRG